MRHESTIGVDDAIHRMICVSEYVRYSYEKLLDEWQPDVVPLTIMFSNFGRSICDNAKNIPERQMTELWNVIEVLVTNGDEQVKNAITTGLLETVLAESSAGRFSVVHFSKHFGDNTKAYCRAWDEFTGNTTGGVN